MSTRGLPELRLYPVTPIGDRYATTDVLTYIKLNISLLIISLYIIHATDLVRSKTLSDEFEAVHMSLCHGLTVQR